MAREKGLVDSSAQGLILPPLPEGPKVPKVMKMKRRIGALLLAWGGLVAAGCQASGQNRGRESQSATMKALLQAGFDVADLPVPTIREPHSPALTKLARIHEAGLRGRLNADILPEGREEPLLTPRRGREREPDRLVAKWSKQELRLEIRVGEQSTTILLRRESDRKLADKEEAKELLCKTAEQVLKMGRVLRKRELRLDEQAGMFVLTQILHRKDAENKGEAGHEQGETKVSGRFKRTAEPGRRRTPFTWFESLKAACTADGREVFFWFAHLPERGGHPGGFTIRRGGSWFRDVETGKWGTRRGQSRK